MTKSFITKTRWLVTIILLTTLAVGQMRAVKVLSFDFSDDDLDELSEWPTSAGSATTKTYELNNEYTFALGANIYMNSTYLMLNYTTSLGLPAISGYKLTKVEITNSSGCSTSTRVGISSSSSSASYVTGGAYQTYSSRSTTYTYNLTSTNANTVYYIYVTNKNCQIVDITLTYTATSKFKVTFEGGTGTPASSSLTESSIGAGVTLPSASPSAGCASDYEFMGWAPEEIDETDEEPTLYFAGNQFYPESDCKLYAVYVADKAATTYYKLISDKAQLKSGEDYIIEAYYTSGSYGYDKALKAATVSTNYIDKKDITSAISSGIYHEATADNSIVWTITKSAESTVQLYNSSTSKYLRINSSSPYYLQINASSSSFALEWELHGEGYVNTFAFKSSSKYVYYDSSNGRFGSQSSSNKNIYLYKRTYSGTFNTNPECASCDATPTVGAASLNGSFTLSSVGVQCASASAGDGCTLSEYGFVWGTSNTGTHPDATDNVVTNAGAYAANYTNTLSSTFSTGVTYYYRGYAKNNGDYYGYSSEVKSFTPYKVYYNKNNVSATGSITDQIVNTGGSVTLSDGTGFTLSHYHIDHWAKGSAGGTSYNKGATYSSITANAEFYAIWAINSWAFAWDFDGGSSSETAGTNYTAAATLDYGTSITKPSNGSMSKTGYTFNGWNSSATSMPDEALTIKALWTANKYDITYKDKGNVSYSGNNSGSLPAKHTYGSATALVNGAKTGYTFDGWFTDSDCTESAGSSIGATAITDGITLYAKWTANTYKVSFNKNGGSGDAMSDQNFTYDVAQSLSTNTYTPPTDKYFIGWNTDKDATTALYEDEESVSNLTSTANGTVTLYAIWKDHTYTNYRTTCCDKKVALSHNSPSNGTVVFSKSNAITCDGSDAITMTITPSAGYYLSDWSTTESVSPSSPSTSPAVSSGDVEDDDEQEITLTFAQNSTGTYTANATFTAKPLEGWSWKYKKGADVADGSVAPYEVPLVVESYIDEYVRFVIDGYSPADVISDKQGYVYTAGGVQPVYSTTYLTYVGKDANASYLTIKGKAATEESTTIVFKSVGNADVTQTFKMKINALPTVTFVDLIHNKVDFTNSGSGYTASTGVLTSTVTTGVVSHSGKTPAHSDIDVPESGNDCELSHLHLIGWIRSDYSKVANYLNGTGSAPTDSEITSAGTDDGGLNYYFTPDVSIDIEDYNGFTFYAVWSKIK